MKRSTVVGLTLTVFLILILCACTKVGNDGKGTGDGAQTDTGSDVSDTLASDTDEVDKATLEAEAWEKFYIENTEPIYKGRIKLEDAKKVYSGMTGAEVFEMFGHNTGYDSSTKYPYQPSWSIEGGGKLSLVFKSDEIEHNRDYSDKVKHLYEQYLTFKDRVTEPDDIEVYFCNILTKEVWKYKTFICMGCKLVEARITIKGETTWLFTDRAVIPD